MDRTSSGVRVLGGITALLLGVVLIWSGLSVGTGPGQSGGTFVVIGALVIVVTLVVMFVTAIGDALRNR